MYIGVLMYAYHMIYIRVLEGFGPILIASSFRSGFHMFLSAFHGLGDSFSIASKLRYAPNLLYTRFLSISILHLQLF